jgi:short-subunit dehydrogenase
MMAGKRLEIPGLANQAIAMSHRFAPRGLVLKIARAFNVGTK